MRVGAVSMEKDAFSARVDWTAVAVYFAIACLVSWPFFWWRDMEPESWRAWRAPGFLKTASYMWGPGIGALACLLVFRRRHTRTITLLGTSAGRSLCFFLLPLAAFGLFGGQVDSLRGPWAAGVIALLAFSSIFGEELGWRGFLQDALRPLAPWKRWVIIGVLWEFWHFTNRTHSGSLVRTVVTLSISYPMVIAVAWLIGKATERTRSLLVATTLHLWVNIVAEASGDTMLPVFLALAVSIATWVWLLRGWQGREAQALALQ
ncbi:MAG TPA: CPBP family intramembrane glutamic endopeptidase [Vulgatibacter sp.]